MLASRLTRDVDATVSSTYPRTVRREAGLCRSPLSCALTHTVRWCAYHRCASEAGRPVCDAQGGGSACAVAQPSNDQHTGHPNLFSSLLRRHFHRLLHS